MRNTQHSKTPRNRRGSLLTEGIIACIILGVAISMLVPALSAIGRQRQAMRFDTLAMIELNNIAAAVMNSDLPSTEIKVSKWFSDRYSSARLVVEPLPAAGDATKGLLEGLRLTLQRPVMESTPEQKISVVVWRNMGEPRP